jgi:hypothetical protein
MVAMTGRLIVLMVVIVWMAALVNGAAWIVHRL